MEVPAAVTGLDPTAQKLVELAVREDLGDGDITGLATVAAGGRGRGAITAKQELVLAGTAAAVAAAHAVDAALGVRLPHLDGHRLHPGDLVAAVEGSLRSILAAERVMLNFLCHLSGVATLTRKCVDAVAGTQARVYDTRKTLPGMRALQKQAVAAGGGMNHRMGLYDAFLIKDNHIAAAGSITGAVRAARAYAPGRTIEVEVEDFTQLHEALGAGADIILLDNMTVAQLREAVRLVAGRAQTEASGGVRLENLREIALTGVDRISMGALTHSAPVADMAMAVERTSGVDAPPPSTGGAHT